ncbi:MAG: tRNA threonylcarbamoyladenosine dehydratase [Oscillospiraceae bacterium]|nr:tRNA threonylcarbamoyladenosine dehydratase [Oscillospiraceae bacterium]MDD4413837.1 tRNA threonylcarbamoyladenosine dehydratase [Oscillospiraceae bacterium]
MNNEFSRTYLLLGKEGMEKLKGSTVAVFGIGGVGSFAAEGLARCGVGKLILIDNDKVCVTNINRQLIATQKTIGRLKVEVMRERILEINPQAQVDIYPLFYNDQTAELINLIGCSFIVDAIDTVSSKLILIKHAKAAGIPIISSMGAGNKLDPTKFEVTDIYKTSVCPLAKIMRHELRKEGISELKVVYSTELPIKPDESNRLNNDEYPTDLKGKGAEGRPIPGSVSFVPSVAGLIIAGEVVKDIIV